MDPLSGLALLVVGLAALLYAVYWVIRRGVAAGVRDARRSTPDPEEKASARRHLL